MVVSSLLMAGRRNRGHQSYVHIFKRSLFGVISYSRKITETSEFPYTHHGDSLVNFLHLLHLWIFM